MHVIFDCTVELCDSIDVLTSQIFCVKVSVWNSFNWFYKLLTTEIIAEKLCFVCYFKQLWDYLKEINFLHIYFIFYKAAESITVEIRQSSNRRAVAVLRFWTGDWHLQLRKNRGSWAWAVWLIVARADMTWAVWNSNSMVISACNGSK